MKNGKLSENILKRSVLRNISKNKEMSVPSDFVTVAQTIVDKYNQLELTSKRALYRCFNRLWAEGITPVGVQLAFTLSDRVSEKKLSETMKLVDLVCSSENVEILGGHTEVSEDISRSVVTITAFGRGETGATSAIKLKNQPQVVMTKWVALGTTSSLVQYNREFLEKRLPSWLLDEAESFDKYLSARDDALIARDNGALIVKTIGSKGIFGSLWELGQSVGAGMEIGLRDIPIRQETVEACELLDMNPYELDSCGSLLVVTDSAESLVEKYIEAGISATVIGRLNSSNDRVLITGEERRFIDRA